MNRRTRDTLIGYAFVSPWIIGLLLFLSVPFLLGFYFSFCEYPPLKGPLFIGTENYTELATDSQFMRSLGITTIYAAIAIPLGVFGALVLAMLLNSRVRGQSFYRVIYFLPHLVPVVVTAILWKSIFNPEYRLFNLVRGRFLTGVNLWTALWFNLTRAASGSSFFTLSSLILLIVPLALVAVWSARFNAPLRQRPSLHRFLQPYTVVLAVLASLACLNAAFTFLAPHDMTALQRPGWLSDGTSFPSAVPFAPSWALWGLIILSLWGTGQMALIYLAKLQDVPVELYEAADVDGANWLHKTLHVTIPMMSPVILFNVIMGIIGTFQVFVEPYIMTSGGPEGKTRFVAMFVYDNAFQYQRLGYASAVAWVLFLIIVILTLLAFRLLRERVYYAGE